MLRKVWSSDGRFKAVEFSEGLNVLLAERTIESGAKDTRNGAGKTTFLNILHFCLGSDLHNLSLPKEELSGWTFYIELDICDVRVTASRSIDNPKNIQIHSTVPELAIEPEVDKEGILFYSNVNWKTLLGKCLFNIQEQYETKYTPSFRSLVSYFMRKGADAYTDPFKHFRNQKTFDVQVNNAFLLGLNWVHASEAQEIRDKESATKALSEALKVGIVASQGELEAERVRLDRQIRVESEAIKSFNVHPQYKELQDEANSLTKAIHETTNQLLILKRKLERYENSISEERVPDSSSIEKLYEEAGVLFNEGVKRTLNEAKAFHQNIVKNRQLFLEAEIAQLKNEIIQYEDLLESSTNQRGELLKMLENHGALEEFTVLQERIVIKRGKLQEVLSKISNLKDLSKHKKEIKSSKIELETKIQRDYEESRSDWEEAIILFNENSKALYDEPGNLIINPTDKGYKLDVEINKSSSEGVGKMKIFCYDLMLVQLMNKKGGIDFLFHDSSIFDGVDSRQRALALMFAAKTAEEAGFQYICAINSDMIPTEDFDSEFNFSSFIKLVLKDQKPEDASLGFHFELKKRKK